MSFRFLVDGVIKNRHSYPALARWQARPYTQSWREFGQHWPYTIPMRIEEYCHTHRVNIDYRLSVDDTIGPICYPIALAFFDFEIDYIGILPNHIRRALDANNIYVLFMYHEGDHPGRIRRRLEYLSARHDVDPSLIKLISSNSMADSIPHSMTFHDFELWYHQRNQHVPAARIHNDIRTYEFLCMNRLHKSWRLAVMADLWHIGCLEKSLWSYCEKAIDTDLTDCPFQFADHEAWKAQIESFQSLTPKYIDDLSNHLRNDHSVTNIMSHENSYCNIVLESQFDVDQSQGCFLTEKTFKAIKHGQLFFVAGGEGSLESLRKLGYSTFDHLLDNRYDTISDATQRLQYLGQAIRKAQHDGLHNLYQQAVPDLIHNQELFNQVPVKRLNHLQERIRLL